MINKYFKKSTIINLVILLLGYNIYAQEVVFEHITDKDGLYYNWIWDIFKDSEGYLWFSSQEGAFRYDGNDFKTYTFKSVSGFSKVNINCVFEDDNSNIWFGTNEGLIRFQRKTNKYKRFFLDTVGNESSNHINDIISNVDGLLWVGTGNGLFVFNSQTDEFKQYKATYGVNTLNTNVINELFIDSKNNLWVGGGDGVLYFYVPHNDHFLNYKNEENFTNSSINIIYEDHQGYIWLGYNGAGAAKFNTYSKLYVRHFRKSGDENQIVSNLVRGIVENNDHTIWFGTEKGLSILDQENDSFSTLTSNYKNPSGLNDNAVYSMYKEDNGDIWIGTFFGGINVVYNRPRFIHIFTPDGAEDKITGKAIGPIITDEEFLWIGTEDNGLNRFNENSGKFKQYTQKNSNLSYDNIHSLCKDQKGNLWVGTYTGGLNLRRQGSDEFIHFNHSDDNNSLSNNSIYCIYNDSDNNLWIGTRSGLNRYNYQSQDFERIHSDIIGNSFIWDIKEDSLGNIWLCTYTEGVYMLDKKNNFSIKHIHFPIGNTVTLFFRSDNKLLVGSEKQGLIIFDTETEEYTHLTTEQGLPDNTIYGFVEDNSHFVWFTTRKGLCKTPDFEKIETFTIYDGLPTNIFNYNSTAFFNGKLYFGSTQGLIVVDPEMQITESINSKLHFTSVTFPDKTKINKFGECVDYLEELELGYNFSSFSINYVGINFRESNKVRYAIKMEGIDNNWNYVGGSRIANYNDLKPGSYRFCLRTVDKYGELLNNEKCLSIRIIPPWWKTLWAKFTFGLLLGSIISFIIYLLILRTRTKHALEIEKIEKLKIRDVNDAKIKFFTNISHEFKTPLTLIKGPINELITDKQITDKQKKWYHSLIKNNTERLLHLINELLEFRNISQEHLELKLETVNVGEVIDNISENYFWLAESHNINFTIHIDETVRPICLDIVKLEKILNNLLLNAFNNTPKNGYISIEANIKESFLRVFIKNSGAGLSSDTINQLFDRDFTLKSTNELYQGTGIGLAYTKTLVELHNGIINVYSLENVETSFIVKFPTNLIDTKNSENNEFHIAIENNKSIEESVSTEIDFIQKNIKPKILIVEDVKDLRDFICEALKDKYSIISSINGLDAFKMAQAENPDIIVSDVMMPKMNGYELCSKIKNTFTTSHIRVVLLTVLSEDSDKMLGYKSGADAYISKPFDVELLISRINNLIKDSYILKQKFQKDLNVTPKEITFSNPDEELLKVIIDTVNKYVDDANFDVDKFASEIGLSKSTLYRKMKSITGLSTNEFVQIIRLKKAAQLLTETDKSVSEVAYEIGFNDPYYFSRAFKKNFNLSPKNYRDKYR